MKKYYNVSELIIEYVVLEKDLKLRKWLRIIIVKNNPISIVQDEVNRDFTRFKHNIGIKYS